MNFTNFSKTFKTLRSLRLCGEKPVFFRTVTIGFTLIALLFLASPALAQAPDANVEFFRATPAEDQPITVGDLITLRLEVSHPPDSTVDLPQLDKTQPWGSFELVDQTAPQTLNTNGVAITTQNIVVRVFEPGPYQTPALVVTHRWADGTTEELGSPVVQLTVSSVLTETLTLRDLKPQADLPVPPIWPYIMLGVLAAILGLGLLAGLGLWLYDRRKRRAMLETAPAIPLDTRPPEVIAYAELDRIEALDLPAQKRIKEHFSLVDLCLRRYIEGRYQLPALEQTRAELQSAFRRSPVPAEHAAEFMTVLSESDLVKFARYTPQVENVAGLVHHARAIVELTTPQIEAGPLAVPETEAVQ